MLKLTIQNQPPADGYDYTLESKEFAPQILYFSKQEEGLNGFITYVADFINEYQLKIQLEGVSAHITLNFTTIPSKTFYQDQSENLFLFDLEKLSSFSYNTEKNQIICTFSQNLIAISDDANGLLACEFSPQIEDGSCAIYSLKTISAIPKLQHDISLSTASQNLEQAFCIKIDIPFFETRLNPELCNKFCWLRRG